MKKNIQNSVDTNWKSYQAVAQANIQSLKDLEIISYTRFNSSTRLYVGDDILVNNKLARIGSVFIDEVYGHKYSIAYPEMSLGQEEIIFSIEWVQDISILPEDNNIVGFKLEQVDTTELIVDVNGKVSSLKLTPYKTLVTPNNIVGSIDDSYQADFKGTEIVDIESTESGTLLGIGNITPTNNTSTISQYQLVCTNVEGLPIVNGVEQVVESEEIIDNINVTTFTPQITSTNILEVSGTFDRLDYTMNVSTPTEQEIDISKTITQDVGQGNFTQYQMVAREIDGAITVNGVEQVVESVETTNNDIKTVILKDFVEPKSYKYMDWIFCTGLDISTRLPTSSYSTDGLTYNTDEKRNYFSSHLNDNNRLGDITITFHEPQKIKVFEFQSSPYVSNNGTDAFTIEYYNSLGELILSERYENLFSGIVENNLILYRLDRLNPPKYLNIDYPKPQTIFISQIVDTDTLEISVNGTIERLDTTLYINEDIVTTIEDTDSIIDLVQTDLPYTLTQEADQTNFNNYLVSTLGLDRDSTVTVNGRVQTIEIDVAGVCSLETSNDLFDIVRVFDYKTVASENIFSDFIFNTPTTFRTMEDIPLGQQLLLDNLNFASLDSKELISIPNDSLTESISFVDTITISNPTENWIDYKMKSMTNIGDLVVNGLTQVVESVEEVEVINFDILFQNGIDMGSAIDYSLKQIMGHRVTGTAGAPGRYSMNMQEVYDTGCRELKFNVTSGTNGAVYIGRYINGEILDHGNVGNIFYNTSDIDYILNLETKVLSYTVNGGIDSGYDFAPDFTNIPLSEIVIGISAIQSSDGWTQWNITPFTKTVTTFEKVSCDTNELVIIGDCESLDYTTTTLDYLQPEYTVTHQDYSRVEDENGVTHNFDTVSEPRYITKKPIKKIVINNMLQYGSYMAFGGVSFMNGTSKFNNGISNTNNTTIFSSNELTAISTSTYSNGSMYYVGYTLNESASNEYQYWLAQQPNTSQSVTYTFTEEQSLDKMTIIPIPLDTNRGIIKATITSYDIDDNIIGQSVFNTPEISPNTKYEVDLNINNIILPLTMKSFKFPELSVSYHDIDSETTVGPIEKSYDTINISEDKVVFDYNDETKVNTNKIDFEPTNVKEIIVRTKKIKKDI